MTLKLRKCETSEVIDTQLSKELKILVTVGQLADPQAEERGEPEHISNFGIRAIDYKVEDSLHSLIAGSNSLSAQS